MNFREQAIIPASILFRAALSSPTRGNRIVDELCRAGRIEPLATPTGRRVFTPHDGEIVFDELVNG